MSNNDIILGIDLGTTTSEAAIYDKKKVKIMHDGDGDEIIISAVGINPKTKKQIVGKKAAGQAKGNCLSQPMGQPTARQRVTSRSSATACNEHPQRDSA